MFSTLKGVHRIPMNMVSVHFLIEARRSTINRANPISLCIANTHYNIHLTTNNVMMYIIVNIIISLIDIQLLGGDAHEILTFFFGT